MLASVTKDLSTSASFSCRLPEAIRRHNQPYPSYPSHSSYSAPSYFPLPVRALQSAVALAKADRGDLLIRVHSR